MVIGKGMWLFKALVLSFIVGLFPVKESIAQGQSLKVGVFKVRQEPLNTGREYVGHVEAMAQVEVRAKVQGYIEEIKFKEGSFVTEGQVLYVLEQAPFKAEVEVCEARLEQAKAELFRATKYLQRLKEVKEGGVSQFEMEKATADELKAKADVKLREAELKNAMLNLGYTQVRSPISGKIGQSLFKKGALVGPSTGPLAKVVSFDPVRILFSPSERDIPKITAFSEDPSFSMLLEQPQEKALQIPVRLDFIDNQVDPNTGTISVWLKANNPKGVLVPGQYVKVRWVQDTSRQALVVPQATVLQDQKGRYLLVVENGQVKEKRVRLGQMLKDMWVVEEGVEVGDMVILEGLQKVRPGQNVEVMEVNL